MKWLGVFLYSIPVWFVIACIVFVVSRVKGGTESEAGDSATAIMVAGTIFTALVTAGTWCMIHGSW
jgi:hypothetical protein